MESAELVVIGAGWHGLAMARTYLECHANAKVVILDSQDTVGGVWAKERIFPTLRTNNLLGTYEFSDFPMDDTFGAKAGEHMTGPVVHGYFHRFAEQFDLYRHLRFRTKVASVEHVEGGKWIVTALQKGESGEKKSQTILTDKLAVASGLTSQPLEQDYRGSTDFDAPLFHVKDLPVHQDDVLRTAKRVAVVGGSKFACDAVYAFASAGVSVDWILRKSGHGPHWMSPPYVTRLKLRTEELVTTRALSWFTPCVWGDADGFGTVRRFLHGTRIGGWMVDAFWRFFQNELETRNAYDKHRETAKLKPWTDLFWHGASISMLNYPTDFFEHLRQGTVKVHVDDIEMLSNKTVHLSSGEAIPADAFVYSSGWVKKPPFKFLPEGIDSKLGLYGAPKDDADDAAATRTADEEIFRRFPRLKDQPVRPSPSDERTPSPYRLYRAIAPPALIHERSIVFCGYMQTFMTPLMAQTQALWATAYLDGGVRLPSSEEVHKETMLHSQYCRWRCSSGRGGEFPDLVFDVVPYVDMLFNDMGLKSRRKRNIVAECFEPYGMADYRGVVDEYRTRSAAR
ncbi:FAD/NAD(P)-binding domain-containing protein [Heliocybe sulcata]|uniref:FAD/NAD(P)-binding domain-containing protein n=1 Tax=Heliocybe sulcata TaxID=5364 RepID=A0A5C3MZQ0_9AGAM|nr:FAD/NAD(P)-binding domain-containing protein [Heliocybe sulcata]